MNPERTRTVPPHRDFVPALRNRDLGGRVNTDAVLGSPRLSRTQPHPRSTCGISRLVRFAGLEPGLSSIRSQASSGEKSKKRANKDFTHWFWLVCVCAGCWVPTVKPDAVRRARSTPPFTHRGFWALAVGSGWDWLAHRSLTCDGGLISAGKQTKQV